MVALVGLLFVVILDVALGHDLGELTPESRRAGDDDGRLGVELKRNFIERTLMEVANPGTTALGEGVGSAQLVLLLRVTDEASGGARRDVGHLQCG